MLGVGIKQPTSQARTTPVTAILLATDGRRCSEISKLPLGRLHLTQIKTVRLAHRCAGGRVRASQSSEPPPADWLSGGKQFTREVLTAYELGNSGFGPRVFGVGSFLLPLMAALPTSIGDAVRSQGSSEGLAVLAGNAALVFLGALFIRGQIDERTQKLGRLAKELALGDLKLSSPDRLGNEKVRSLRELRNSRRLAIVYGSYDKVQQDIATALVYRRRLEASSIIVVPVVQSTGEPGDRRAELPSGYTLLPPADTTWVAWPLDAARQVFQIGDYFEELLAESQTRGSEGAYITLGLDGRVRGSGEGSPRWDTLLSTFPQQKLDRAGVELAPAAPNAKKDISSESDLNEAGASAIQLHERFYDALDRGDDDAMSSLWSSAPEHLQTTPISQYQEKGARLDPWSTVLREDRRPIGMKVSDADVLLGPDGETAWVTSVETVANGSTLLATQTLKAVDGEWQLVQHQTIPYGKDIVAKVVLTCDARGCVALPAKAVASSVSARNFKLK
ncbi:hypothetical protein CYMTET_16260 [Cymbomonas tetramitiformis]|uniref:SnoaL-like domain-containing protein n=1 Tax=Cymbomonas tetramitiformis TaxID=36881 RepID=A0AAE0GCX4_9CHLO|nr:hypothetical protein CYMTET_16260 [Cymbomonas tetramitiformis]